MNFVDHFLDEQFAELRLAALGLPRGLRSALVTPGFATSRHVLAMVFPPGAARPVLVVKVPRRLGDDSGVETEARMLRLLSDGADTAVPGVPRFVGLVRRHGHAVLIEEAVDGVPLDPAEVRRDLTGCVEAGLAFTAGLPSSDGTLDRQWYAEHVERPLQALAALAPFGSRTEDVVTRTHEFLGPLRRSGIRAVVEHGDLSHPNIFRGADGTLRVIDWERGCTDGMPGQDLAFYLTYLHESWRHAFTREAQLVSFDEAFVGPGAPACVPLRSHLGQRDVDPGLLPQIVVATFARAAATLVGRLLPEAAESEVDPEVFAQAREAVAGDRDVMLWGHALDRGALIG